MNKEFFKDEWYLAEKNGNEKYAKACKEEYRLFVMKELERPYRQFFDELKQFPAINLN